nr:hypothetical protein Barb4_02032 [Ipomoea batatas]GMD41504.1 hypothetical protein Barb4_02032 [Ipomoea batatas]GMD44456.1 hypothetical protein Barb4_02032 [Ipomoea batatas]
MFKPSFKGMMTKTNKSLDNLVHQPERYSFITNKSLVVTFSIRNTFFQPSSVSKCVNNFTHLPILISSPENLNPFIGNCHMKPIVKTHASISDGNTKCWHATNIFTNGYGFREETMNEIIDEHQIHHSINISCIPKIFTVVSSESYTQPMMSIHH